MCFHETQYSIIIQGVDRYSDRLLAEYLIAETASQDPKVGGPIHLSEITPENGYRELSGSEVETIHQSNSELNARLRDFFLKGGKA